MIEDITLRIVEAAQDRSGDAREASPTTLDPSRSRVTRHRTALAVLVLFALAPRSGLAQAVGDATDQFYRFVENKNKQFTPHLPGETVDNFTGNLRITEQDLWLPGRAGLDLQIVRSYSSKIWGRTDLLAAEPLLADKDPSPVGLGWTMHMGRVRNPNASGQPLACGGGDYPIYEAPDGSARTFYPLPGSNINFISRDSWKLSKDCSLGNGAVGICITDTTGKRLEFSRSEQYFIGTTLSFPLTAMVDVFGNAIQVAYVAAPAAGLVGVITDSFHRTVTFNYSACAGRTCLDSIHAAGPGGSRDVRYAYTTYTPAQTGGAGRLPLPSPGRPFLTSVQPAAGPGHSYEYGFPNPVAQNQYALTRITYPSGGSTSYVYTTSTFFTGRDSVPMAVVASRTTAGRAVTSGTWTYSYSAPSTADFQTTTITRPDAVRDVYQFYGFGYASRMNTTGSLWIVGLPRSVSRADGLEVETSTWDRGQAVTTANYSAPFYGNSACPSWTWDTEVHAPVLTSRVTARGSSRYEVSFAGHDAFGQPASITERGEAERQAPAVRTSSFTYAPDSATYQVVGRIKSEHVCLGASATDCRDVSRTFTGPHARMDSETNMGVRTTFGYSTPEGDLETVTNALGQTLTLSGYTAGLGIPTVIDFNHAYTITRTASWDGSLRSETNGRGDVTSYTYDPAGRPATMSPPGASDPITYTYSATGDSYSNSRGSGAALYTSTTSLDGLGRVTRTSDSLGEVQTREYDEFGRATFVSSPFKIGGVEIGDRTEYDALGRRTATLRRFAATGHLPLTGACTDAASCQVAVSYLAGHCRSTIVDRAAGDRATTTACFESFGDPGEERLVTTTDASGKVWSYTHDVVGNLTRFAAPLPAGDRSFTYAPGTFFLKSEQSGATGTSANLTHNATGQPLTRRDARGIDVTLAYDDPLSRLTSIKYGSGSPDDVTRTYDRDTLKTVSSANGGSYTYGYDERNRISSVSWSYQGHSYVTSYAYDRTGCLTSLVYPTGTKLTMTCDARGRTVSVTNGSAIIASGAEYQPSGRPTAMTYGNGQTVRAMIEDGRVKSISSPGVFALSYSYDGASNVTSITDASTPGNPVSTITYDKLDRLLSVTSARGVATYTYDELGNRTSKTPAGGARTTYTYDPVTNRLVASSGPGAPLPMTLTWNPAGRLESTSDGTLYKYNASGQRVAKQSKIGSVDVVYHHDVSGRLLAETTPDGTKIREFYYLADQLIAVDGCVSGSGTGCTEREWYHTDVLGNVVARTDTKGSVVSRFAYLPWGEVQGTVSGTRFFNGRPLDQGTLFYDLGARVYSPELGRLISADAAWTQTADPQSSNLYAYSLNNPFKYNDPTGRVPFLLVTGGIGAVVGGLTAAYVSYQRDGTVSLPAVAEGIAVGGLIGLGVGAFASVAVTGSATAGTGAVLQGAGAWAAGLLGLGGKTIEHGQREFSGDSGGGAIASNVIQTGDRMLFQNFTVLTTGGDDKLRNGSELYSALRMILDFARVNDARVLTFEGKFVNGELAARYGMEAGDTFSFTAEATLRSLLSLMKGIEP